VLNMTCWVSWVFIFVDILKAGKMLLARQIMKHASLTCVSNEYVGLTYVFSGYTDLTSISHKMCYFEKQVFNYITLGIIIISSLINTYNSILEFSDK
jgi:hypothetical protein